MGGDFQQGTPYAENSANAGAPAAEGHNNVESGLLKSGSSPRFCQIVA